MTRLTQADLEYVRANFVPVEEVCLERGRDLESVRREIRDGRLPKPSYVLDDGTEMVPADYLELVDEAGGAGALHDVFVGRYVAAAAKETVPLAAPEEEWAAYLTGEYGVCLRKVTPETIARKSALVAQIEGLLAEAAPGKDAWRRRLRETVDELDELEREFAPFDRIRFGGPVSRDRLIADVRKRYPQAFQEASVA